MGGRGKPPSHAPQLSDAVTMLPVATLSTEQSCEVTLPSTSPSSAADTYASFPSAHLDVLET